jgi:hypothetical protein
MSHPRPTLPIRSVLRTLAASLVVAPLLGCKPPPPSAQSPSAQPPAAQAPAAANSAGNSSPPATKTPGKQAEGATIDGLPAKVVENVEQVIKLTAEYNARAEKITDRQTYLEQSDSLAALENELSDYVQYMEAVEPTLTATQQATLDSKYFSRAKPLIDAKRQHKMRLLALLQ